MAAKSRRDTILNAVLLGIVIVDIAMPYFGEKTEQNENQAESRYIAANKCVGTKMTRHYVEQYRCDAPIQRYLTPAQLTDVALAAAAPTAK